MREKMKKKSDKKRINKTDFQNTLIGTSTLRINFKTAKENISLLLKK